MKTHIRTYPIKGLMIFLIITFVVSSAAVIYFALSKDDVFVVRLLVWIFCGAFSLISLFMIFQQLSCFVEVKEDYFIQHSFLTRKKILISDIERIRHKEENFFIYKNNQIFAQFPSYSKQAQQIAVYLDKKHVKIDW